MPNNKEPKQKLRFLPYNLRKFASLTSIPENNSSTSAERSNISLAGSNSTISDFSSCSISDTMSTEQPAQNQANNQIDIFNSLRIPDAIKDLPKFDGNSKLLYEFLNNVEEILLYIRGTDNTPYGQILLRAIRNKIEGQANEVLNMYGTPLIWDEIKNNLVLHYSDKRTETSLIRDLHTVRQFNKTIESFYGEIIELQSSLCNNILIHERDTGVINAKKNLYSEMCLNSFLVGLNEPLGSRVRAMQPTSLSTALSCCIKEQNISYQRVPTSNRGHYSQYRPYDNRFYRDQKYQPPSRQLQPQPTNWNHNWQRNHDHRDQRYQHSNRQQQPQQTNQNFRNNSRHQNPLQIKASPSQQTRFAGNTNLNFHETIPSNNYQQLDRYIDNDPNNYNTDQNPQHRDNFFDNAYSNGPSTSGNNNQQLYEHYNIEPTNIEEAQNFFTTASNNQPVT